MKLFVWVDPYEVEFGTSMLFAVAETLEEAKAEAMRGQAYAFGEFKQDRVPVVELGAPTRVLDLPCAEWHEWSE